MDDRRLDIHALDDATLAFVRECEVAGRRTVFARDDRPVSILISWDEYLALRETIEIGSDDALLAEIERAEDEVRRGALMLTEDLVGE